MHAQVARGEVKNHIAVIWVVTRCSDTSVSEDPAISVFIVVSYHIITWRHNPGDHIGK